MDLHHRVQNQLYLIELFLEYTNNGKNEHDKAIAQAWLEEMYKQYKNPILISKILREKNVKLQKPKIVVIVYDRWKHIPSTRNMAKNP